MQMPSSFIDSQTLRSIDALAFRERRPFPWVNPQGFLTADGFATLLRDLPDVARFHSAIDYDRVRKHGQKNHDRYVLEYVEGIELAPSWNCFIAELRADAYRSFIASLLGHPHFRFRFHWHYTPSGCSVSPHCDSRTKLGSHIFYLNEAGTWDPDWGGETIILDDNGRFAVDSSPQFEDFDSAVSAQTMHNHSLIFGRRGNSWHGVREIRCPEGELRKVFIVVLEEYRATQMLRKRVTRLLKGKPLVSEKERGMY